ncbi:MAG: hypothetical protein RMJ19_11030 [Gemmatales bacterium]|nr:hypothetical protein [Gemmatales bacterium]MCS7160993.1 hypothetical protein [Gemmatales bacterium]MDW8176196.1 hypothetical protein [Gemmatales bacterium]MDW8223746.1 hypothetical protein [Gemmatales bacterium]
MTELLQILLELAWNLARLVVVLAALTFRYALVVGWLAWWLWLVDWRRLWPALRQGAWVPLLLGLALISYITWLLGVPIPGDKELGRFAPIALTSALLTSVLLCGWVQTVFAWHPLAVSFEPAVSSAPAEGSHHLESLADHHEVEHGLRHEPFSPTSH